MSLNTIEDGSGTGSSTRYRPARSRPPNKKPAGSLRRVLDGRKIRLIQRLTLGELEGPAGLATTELLTFNDTAVTGQEAVFLQNAAQFRLVMSQGL